ncbi:MAG: hypothetical protein ACTSRK_07630 [Promethearchaeota archaeon]
MSKSHPDSENPLEAFFNYAHVLAKAEEQLKLGVLTQDQFLRIRAGCEQKLKNPTKTETEAGKESF